MTISAVLSGIGGCVRIMPPGVMRSDEAMRRVETASRLPWGAFCAQVGLAAAGERPARWGSVGRRRASGTAVTVGRGRASGARARLALPRPDRGMCASFANRLRTLLSWNYGKRTGDRARTELWQRG